jgi:hypothetical protein
MSETTQEFLETEVSDEPDTDDSPEIVRPPLGTPLLSGHCAFPQTADPQQSHDRCARNGAGNRSNPAKVFSPCPCHCHLGERYECGNCGRTIAEAPFWDGRGGVGDEMVYVHIDPDGRGIGEDCP